MPDQESSSRIRNKPSLIPILNKRENSKYEPKLRSRSNRISRKKSELKTESKRPKKRIANERQKENVNKCWLSSPKNIPLLFLEPFNLVPKPTMNPGEKINVFTRLLIVLVFILWVLSIGNWLWFLVFGLILIAILYIFWARHPPVI